MSEEKILDSQANTEPVVDTEPEPKVAETEGQSTSQPAPTPEPPKVVDKVGEEEVKPEPIEYKFPENFTDDYVTKAETLELLNKHSVSQEALDDLIPTFTKVAEKVQQKSLEAWRDQVKTWAEESAKDKEFGGEKYDENLKTVVRPVLDRWGSDELVDILDQTGIAEHPAVIRFLYKVGLDVAKDGEMVFGDRDSKGGATKTLADMARQLYPSMSKDK